MAYLSTSTEPPRPRTNAAPVSSPPPDRSSSEPASATTDFMLIWIMRDGAPFVSLPPTPLVRISCPPYRYLMPSVVPP